MRWCRKLTSLDSNVSSEILLPISFNRLSAEELRTSRVSTATDSRNNSCPDLHICPASVMRPPLLVHLPHGHLPDAGLGQTADHSDVPAQRLAAPPRDECQTVRSLPVRPRQPGRQAVLWRAPQLRQRNELPSRWGHGASQTVPGLSCKESLDYNHCVLYIATCKRPMAFCCLINWLIDWQLWSSQASTTVPQWHLCCSHRSRPSLKPTATLTALSSSFRPHEAMRMANSQSPPVMGTS